MREAAAEAALRWGAGAGASRLISGNMQPHRELETRLAAFKGYERALLFGSGYLANMGTIAALAGPGETAATPMDELVDHQDEANFWDPSTQLRVIKKSKKPPPYPGSDAASSAPARAR